MACSIDYIEFVCEQLIGIGNIRYRKMFGEYMIYLNDKPILLVCDNTVYVKIKDETTVLLSNYSKGYPYKGAKEHYILDIENKELTHKIVEILDSITPLPKPKKEVI